MKTFIFKNSGELRINDVRYPEKLPLEGCSYKISIRPKCIFWRLGLRFSFDTQGSSWSTTNRYNDSQIRHIEVCVGTRPNNEWKDSNLIQLQQYYIPNRPSTLYSSGGYKELSEVELTICSKEDGHLDVSISFGTDIYTYADLDLQSRWAFDIYAWADSTDFEIECDIIPEFVTQKIDLNTIKALTNQKTSLSLNKLAIFFGTNNCGKTSVLVGACNAYMNKNNFSMDYLGINRIHAESPYNFEVESLPDYERYQRQKDNRKLRSGNSIGQNQLFNWMEELALQDEESRKQILAWVNTYLESWDFKEVKKGRFVTGVEAKVNNANPLDQGTGAKAVLPIIIQLFNPQVKLLAIDEPELGLEPRLQKIVFRAIKDAAQGENGFPPKRILLATHSHLFLDREDIKNNYAVQKHAGVVSLNQMVEHDELQKATFRLLGNNPSDLFFPSNVVIVEGRSDEIFLKSIYQLGRSVNLFSSTNLVFHYLDGFDKLPAASEAIIQMLKTQTYSPIYKDRICGLFDKPHRKGKMIDDVRKYFNDDKRLRFVVLALPAIEYYYPLTVVNAAFDYAFDETTYKTEVDKFLDSVSKKFPFHGEFLNLMISKVDLAKRVVNRMTTGVLDQLDPVIKGLLKKADELAYA